MQRRASSQAVQRLHTYRMNEREIKTKRKDKRAKWERVGGGLGEQARRRGREIIKSPPLEVVLRAAARSLYGGGQTDSRELLWLQTLTESEPPPAPHRERHPLASSVTVQIFKCAFGVCAWSVCVCVCVGVPLAGAAN